MCLHAIGVLHCNKHSDFVTATRHGKMAHQARDVCQQLFPLDAELELWNGVCCRVYNTHDRPKQPAGRRIKRHHGHDSERCQLGADQQLGCDNIGTDWRARRG